MAFTEEQEMMCLAGLTYRGFSDAIRGKPHGQQLHRAVADELERLAITRGRWGLAWGPVAYHATFSVFDDAMVYVVRALDRTNRYVIAIRGTNPISAFDWALGDFWVTVQVPWSHGSAPPEAKISLSTAFGLSLLESMQWAPPSTGVGADLWTLLDTLGAPLRRAQSVLLDRLAALVPQLGKWQATLAGAMPGLEDVRHAHLADPAARVAAILARWTSAPRRAALDAASQLMRGLVAHRSLDVLAILETAARATTGVANGIDLTTFLRGAVKDAAGPVEIVVTGHSKGGCLASTVALWLADTQGEGAVPDEARWDPSAKATVSCYSFAGPTAGNAEFAAYSDATIGERCHRVVNTLDVVPHAWAVDDLRKISTLYGPGIDRQPIADLVRQVTKDVAQLGYTHVGRHVHEIPGVLDPGKPLFFDQFVRQHLTAYLVALGLDGMMNQENLFAPIV